MDTPSIENTALDDVRTVEDKRWHSEPAEMETTVKKLPRE